MSKDIRSYFTILSNKSQSKSSTPPSTSKKRPKAIDSSDDDVIPETPKPAKKQEKPQKKRKVHVLSSDSESEKHSKPKRSGKNKKEDKGNLKPVNALEAFGKQPIKQSKVPEKPKTAEKPSSIDKKQEEKINRIKNKKGLNIEVGIHNDTNFEKTLLELDEDFLIENEDQLNQSINQALNNELDTVKVQENPKSDKASLKGKEKSPKKTNSDEKREQKERSLKEEKQHKRNETSNDPNDKNTDTSKKKGSTSSEEAKTPNRKRPLEHYDGDPDQERYEKKRHSAILYQKYLNRSGPAHHGSKEIPKGKADCLKDLCFIRTGVLDSLESEEFDTIVKSHGGRTVQAVSKKVNYVVAGEEPGPAKIEKAKNYGIKIISEDEFLDLIRIKSGMKPFLVEEDNTVEMVVSEEEKETKNISPKDSEKKRASSKHSNVKQIDSPNKIKSNDKLSEKQKLVNGKSKLDKNMSEAPIKSSSSTPSTSAIKSVESSMKLPKIETNKDNLSWTEKHKPTNVKQIIGQQGDKSNMKRLMVWLENWYKNHSGKNKPKLTRPSPWAKNDDGSYFKAALLSGPPGVGKTTTANLVAKELGFDVVEFNASDTRSKKLLHEEVSQLLSTKSLAGFFVDGSAPTNQHVLLMDEVDGMAGNEDRGGVQELISLIKNSNVPIICMCNDRNHPKVRSLVNYCLDLKFSRPRLEQIKVINKKKAFVNKI
ncbi:hypothetical protein ILUMI_08559 [Ignelater luminosus]|uniref:Replication factor C subunit 1 n=1 Tax=Ignelater luminosus TaxID=2038154 RepID=A0A8K0GAI5_IGNLU|nr:hypothetical protein ILUMI_08559 [Ignelater luminosus]